MSRKIISNPNTKGISIRRDKILIGNTIDGYAVYKVAQEFGFEVDLTVLSTLKESHLKKITKNGYVGENPYNPNVVWMKSVGIVRDYHCIKGADRTDHWLRYVKRQLSNIITNGNDLLKQTRQIYSNNPKKRSGCLIYDTVKITGEIYPDLLFKDKKIHTVILLKNNLEGVYFYTKKEMPKKLRNKNVINIGNNTYIIMINKINREDVINIARAINFI